MRRWLGVSSLAFLTCAAASAQNLLVSPSFDGTAAGWTCTPPDRCDASEMDVYGGAGSAALATGSAVADSAVELGQCIAVTPSTNYDFAGWGYVEPGGPDAILRTAMRWYTDPGCVTFDFSEVLANADEVGAWTPLYRNRTTPAGVASGQFYVQLLKSPAVTGVALAYVDAFYVPEPAANMGAGAACAALAWPLVRRARRRRCAPGRARYGPALASSAANASSMPSSSFSRSGKSSASACRPT
jgi:hypothetical protein